jgi:hypothetical protein
MRIQITVSTIFLVIAVGVVFADAPPYEDEDILGLELSGELLAPPALVSQIGQDLAAIRYAFPEISDIHVFPDWSPGKLIVGLTENGWAEYQAGTFAELDSLNAEYGPVSIEPHPSTRYLVLEYEALYHPEVLAVIYEGIDGVLYAEPNVIGGDGNDITFEQLTLYTLKRGWGDCPSGCIFEDFWVFSVIDGSVDLIAHYGDSVSAVESNPAGQTGLIQGISPNPFNPQTTISFFNDQPQHIRVGVYDIRGGRIAELTDQQYQAGEHSVEWQGRDSAGRAVPSGEYFFRVEIGGQVETRKAMLLR